jgi:putative PEP-CTERM system TPR-repeat lipoprotein
MVFRLLVLISALMLSACFGPKTPQEYIERADSLIANNKHQEAIILYKNLIEENSAFMQARFNLGLIYYSLGDLSSAQTSLVKAYEADYANEQLAPLLADIFFQQNDMTALKHIIDSESKTQSSAAIHLQMSLYKTLYLGRSNSPKLAEAELAKILLTLSVSEQLCELCILTRAHLQSYKLPSEAISTLNTLLKEYPDNPQAYLLRGQLYFALRNPTEAMANFKTFQGLRPMATNVQFLIAITAMQMKDTVNANRYINALLTANPSQPLIKHLKALMVFEQKDYELARKYAEQSIDSGLEIPTNYVIAGVSAYHLGKLEIAYQYLRKGVAFYPENAQLRQLLMFIQFRFGYFEQAGESYVKQDQRNVQNLLLGNVMAYQFIQNGQFDQAENVLSNISNTAISTPVIRLQTQALQNQLALEQTNSLQELVTSEKSTTSEETLIRVILLMQSNSVEKALNEAQQWLLEDPQNIDALNISAYVFQKLEQADKAAPLLAKALIIDPNNTPSLFFLAEQALGVSNYELANKYFSKILQTNPQNLSALRSLLQLTFKYQQAPNWDKLLKLLNFALITDDQIVAVSDAMFQWQYYQDLENFLRAVSPQHEWSDLVWMVWLKNSVYLYGVGQFESKFTTFYENNQDQAHIIFALSILEIKREYSLMLKVIDKASESIQSNDAIQLQKALALVELNRFEQTDEILNTLDNKKTTRATKWFIMGRQMEKKGDLIQAANYLTAYYESLPNFHSVNALANVLVKAKRHNEAVSLAKEYFGNYPIDSSASISLALTLAPSHPSFSLQLLEQEQTQWLIKRNWKLSYNMAWLYFTQEALTKALTHSSHALALNASNQQVNWVHANILIKLGKRPEALMTLQKINQPKANIKLLIDQLTNSTPI